LSAKSSLKFKEDNKHARNTHSAIFVEVKVDEQLGVIRVTRAVNAVAAGRIINTKTAASQIMGSVVWGIGSERQYRGIPCTGERRRARYQGHLC
jgi:xanthine dehydrogenase YagR molybdenum-binding subunit